MALNIFFLVCLFSTIKADFNVKSNNDFNVAEDLSIPFEFFMFENFEETQKILEKEINLFRILTNYRSTLKSRRDAIQKCVEKTRMRDSKDDTYVQRPTNAYSMLLDQLNIKHVLWPWPNHQKDWGEILDSVKNSSESKFPSRQDYEGALRGLVLLFDTYQFDLNEASKGNLKIPQYEGKYRYRVSSLLGERMNNSLHKSNEFQLWNNVRKSLLKLSQLLTIPRKTFGFIRFHTKQNYHILFNLSSRCVFNYVCNFYRKRRPQRGFTENLIGISSG